MKRKRPVAVMDTWPVRADGLLPVEEKKKAFRSYGALSITNCQALSSGEVAEDYYFIFYFFPTCLSNETEIGLHQDPLNFQSGFLKCNHRHTGNLDVSCCTEGQERKKKKTSQWQPCSCCDVHESNRAKEKKRKKKNEMEKFSCPLKTPHKAVILKGSASQRPSLCLTPGEAEWRLVSSSLWLLNEPLLIHWLRRKEKKHYFPRGCALF